MNRRNWFGRLVSVVAGLFAGKAIASHPVGAVQTMPTWHVWDHQPHIAYTRCARCGISRYDISCDRVRDGETCNVIPQLPVHPDVMRHWIQEAIGEASVCWEHIERAGEFQTTAALEVGERLIKRLGSPFEILARQIRRDDGYAWSWHCNIAMAAMDEGMDRAAANRAAARFMRHFGVDTTKHPAYAD